MMEEKKQNIQQMIKTLLEKMGCSGEVDLIEYYDGTQFTIRTRDGGLLIGDNGQNLLALNYILKKMAAKILKEERPQFSIDVNDYQKQKHEELRDLARMSAQRVRYFKKEVVMKPMSSYERRIVHSTLTEYPDIITESQGEEPRRQVVIKPYNP